MCLAVPGKIIGREAGSVPVMGIVDFGGIHKKVCLEWVPEANVGDYVIVHVGFAISKLDEQEALETLRLFRELEGGLDELGGSDQESRNET